MCYILNRKLLSIAIISDHGVLHLKYRPAEFTDFAHRLVFRLGCYDSRNGDLFVFKRKGIEVGPHLRPAEILNDWLYPTVILYHVCEFSDF